MKWFFGVIFVISNVFVPFKSHAALKQIKLQVIIAEGKGAVTDNQAFQVIKGVQSLFKIQLKVDLQLVSYGRMKDPLSATSMLSESRMKYDNWYSLIKDNRLLKQDTITHILLPPMVEGGTYYIGGYAKNVCMRRYGYSVSNAVAKDFSGKSDRLMKSTYAMAHELGHILGADHDKDDSIMNADALRLLDKMPSLSFSGVSTSQIKNCL